MTSALRTPEQQRITDIATCRRNLDSMSRDDAAQNLMDDKPAYWSMAGGSALGISAQTAATANFHGSLITALDEKADRFGARNIDIAKDVLDNLIPLNMEAVREMERCYRLQSTFRDRSELLGRETDAVCRPYRPAWPNHDGEATATMYAELYAAAQERFRARCNASIDRAIEAARQPLQAAE